MEMTIICSECYCEIDPLEPREYYISDDWCQGCSAAAVEADMRGDRELELDRLDWDWLPDLV